MLGPEEDQSSTSASQTLLETRVSSLNSASVDVSKEHELQMEL